VPSLRTRRKTIGKDRPSPPPPPEPAPTWTFLTNHAHVLFCIVQEQEVRMRDIAQRVGITERSVQRIVDELERDGYIRRIPHGRRNRYEVRTDLPLRHPMERHQKVSALIALVLGKQPRRRKLAPPAGTRPAS